MAQLCTGSDLCAHVARLAIFVVAAAGALPDEAAEPGPMYAAVPELKKLSLEELVETPVISASRVPESWFIAPTAIDVFTDDEIRRTGVERLPEVLRYVTGVEVARFAGSSYAISARGFNGVAANKLQVMMDGRSLYHCSQVCFGKSKTHCSKTSNGSKSCADRARRCGEPTP
jgi:iron complex outermembrane receptor protein